MYINMYKNIYINMQGWHVSPLYGKNHGFHPVSPDAGEILFLMREMVEREKLNL
jgi:hypothetical protein